MVQIFDSFNTIDWGGGKSTELFIFPLNSQYKERNFKFRLSTATVEIKSSVFTPLGGVQRKLMVLEGEMNLDHTNKHNSQLKKFDVDEFEGGWETKSSGCCVDFNLMLRENEKGSLNGISLKKDEEINGEFFGKHFFIWTYKGEVEVQADNETKMLKEKDLFYLSDAVGGRVSIKGLNDSDVILVDII